MGFVPANGDGEGDRKRLEAEYVRVQYKVARSKVSGRIRLTVRAWPVDHSAADPKVLGGAGVSPGLRALAGGGMCSRFFLRPVTNVI